MIRIALIGEIASGKTFVAKCFGYPIFNADYEVKKIYKKNKNCFKELNKLFPANIKNFPIRKSEVRSILNKKNVKILGKIVHPYVRLSLKKFLKKYYRSKFIVLDIPLLIENKLNKKNDILIYVKTQKKIILKRLKKRENYNKRVHSILKLKQFNINKKSKLCDYTIINNLDKKNVLRQIRRIKDVLND